MTRGDRANCRNRSVVSGDVATENKSSDTRRTPAYTRNRAKTFEGGPIFRSKKSRSRKKQSMNGISMSSLNRGHQHSGREAIGRGETYERADIGCDRANIATNGRRRMDELIACIHYR